MKRISHRDYADFDFLLFGISSAANELEVCLQLNRLFSIDLERIPDVEIHHPRTQSRSSFCNFLFEKKSITNETTPFINNGSEEKDFDESSVTYNLIGNRHPSGNLIPEQPRIDYFIILSGDGIQEINQSAVVNQLRLINEIQAAFVIDVTTLKSKNNLIF
jgi:hypothetical protein